MRKVVFGAALIIVASAVGFAVYRGTHPPEPRYRGTPLSSLVLQVTGDPTIDPSIDGDKIRSRLSVIDTNALPFLLRFIQYEEPVWRSDLIDHLFNARGSSHARTYVISFHTKAQDLADGSIWAFDALGPRAATAIPTLKLMVNDTAHSEIAFRALRTLRAIGTNSLPALMETLRNPNSRLRPEALAMVKYIEADPGNVISPGLSNELKRLDAQFNPHLDETNGTPTAETEMIDVNTGLPVTPSTKPVSGASDSSTPQAP